ncbi:hypothetical protein J1N35_038069 [Gossypium stocksii]|uniref:Uncharacterized protein n=1 Tax=Gossypium stocksii TaxID=47602 RepID=A0A9D3ZMI3_9ROSI|nr:hypothetical protein J1N35_038069 [Gossypium stocksii]
MGWILTYTNQDILTWLTWVFGRGTKEQIRMFCCALWMIWGSRNQAVHDRKITLGTDLSYQIRNYLLKIEGVSQKNRTFIGPRAQEQGEEARRETIQFDAAFDRSNSKSASGLVVRNRKRADNSQAHIIANEALEKGEGRYLEGETMIYNGFASEEIWPRDPD